MDLRFISLKQIIIPSSIDVNATGWNNAKITKLITIFIIFIEQFEFGMLKTYNKLPSHYRHRHRHRYRVGVVFNSYTQRNENNRKRIEIERNIMASDGEINNDRQSWMHSHLIIICLIIVIATQFSLMFKFILVSFLFFCVPFAKQSNKNGTTRNQKRYNNNKKKNNKIFNIQ